jgi:hypothetical protein
LEGEDAYVPYYDIDVKTRTVYIADNSRSSLAKYNEQNKTEYTINCPEGFKIYGFKLDKRDDSVFVSYKYKKSDGKESYVIAKYNSSGKELFKSKEYEGAYLIDINPSDGSLYFFTIDSVNNPFENKLIRLNSNGREIFSSPLSGNRIECATLDIENSTLVTIEQIKGTAYKKMLSYNKDGKLRVNNDGTLSLMSFSIKQIVAIPDLDRDKKQEKDIISIKQLRSPGSC